LERTANKEKNMAGNLIQSIYQTSEMVAVGKPT